MKRRSKIIIVLLALCLVAAAALTTVFVSASTSSYIDESGKQSVSAVVDQMQQTYDAQIQAYYNDLELAERFLFDSETRAMDVEEGAKFIDAMQQKTGSELVFLKENGVAATLNGPEGRMEIQSQLLLDLENGSNIAKLVSRNAADAQDLCYLIAIPCEPYYVNGERYTALGSLYNRSQIDSLLEVSGYGGQAMLFLIDKGGDITYTNQPGDYLLRNYSLLKHLKKDDALTEEQLSSLQSAFAADDQGVRLLGSAERPYYLGYTPLQLNDSTLVCIVPKSTTNNALLGFQQTIVQLTIVFGVALLLLAAALVYSVFRAKAAAQRARFEMRNSELQKESMRALQIEKKKAESASRSKSEFLANMSHDIRTPMNAIVGLTNLMEHSKHDPEKMEVYIHEIQTSSKHLLSLVNDVLDMSRIESSEVELNRESIDLAEQVGQVDSIIRPQAKERKQRFTIRVHKIVHESLIGDATRLRQLFINLLSNSVKYTQEGGHIELDLAELPGRDDGRALIEVVVTDNGCGMTPEFVEHIFEPFSRVENSTVNRVQGTGLGMAIVKSIVDMMGGSIAVQSEPGRGTRVSVVLPFEIDVQASFELNAQNVLLVARDEVLIENARAAFELAEGELFVARSLNDVEAVLAGRNVEAVLISGRAQDAQRSHIVEALRERAKGAVVIFCVDYGQEDEAGDILAAELVDGIIARPFFLSTFARAVGQARCGGAQAEEKESSVLRGMRFLCAEDNALNAEILQAILDLNGASCVIYPNGEALVEAFRDVRPGDFDAILMDVQMPVMDGLQATRKIRVSANPLGATMPIIAMTANAFSSDVQNCLDAGMDAHVAKPLDIEVLAHAIKSVLASRAAHN